MRLRHLRLLPAAFAVAAILLPALARAQSESVSLVAVAGTGCDNDQFHVTVARANLDGGDPYTVHFVASASGHIYTNQAASVTTDGSSDYYIYTNFSAGPVQDQGVFPLAIGAAIQIDVALERPFGKVITSRRMVVDSCDSGNVVSNGPPPVPTPQHETLQVVGVNGTGCNNDQFNFDVVGSNLDNGPYTMRFVATVAGLVYTNAHQSWVSDDERLAYVFSSFSYGAVGNPGTFPMPSNQPLQVDLTLERPAGTVLYAWRTVVDDCVDGSITFNAEVVAPRTPPRPVPALGPAGVALLALLLGAVVAWRRRSWRRAGNDAASRR